MYGVSKGHAVHNDEVLKFNSLDYNHCLIYTTLSLITSLGTLKEANNETWWEFSSFAAQDVNKVPELIKKLSGDKHSFKYTTATNFILVSHIMLRIMKRQKMWK